MISQSVAWVVLGVSFAGSVWFVGGMLAAFGDLVAGAVVERIVR